MMSDNHPEPANSRSPDAKASCCSNPTHSHQNDSSHSPPAMTAIDPVCGMEVAMAGAEHVSHDGHDYYFCSGRCRERFGVVMVGLCINQALKISPTVPLPMHTAHLASRNDGSRIVFGGGKTRKGTSE